MMMRSISIRLCLLSWMILTILVVVNCKGAHALLFVPPSTSTRLTTVATGRPTSSLASSFTQLYRHHSRLGAGVPISPVNSNSHNNNRIHSKLYSQSSSSSSSSSVNEDEKTTSACSNNHSSSGSSGINRNNSNTNDTYTHTCSAITSKMSPSVINSKNEQQQQYLYKEAQTLRDKAKQLYQEAVQEEEQLLKTKKIQQEEWNLHLDNLINELILLKQEEKGDKKDKYDANNDSSTASNNYYQNNSGIIIKENNNQEAIVKQVIKFIQNNRLSTTKLIHLIERIHEREINAKRKFMDSMNTVHTTNYNGSNSYMNEKGNSSSLSSPFIIGDLTMSKEYNQNELLSLQNWIDYIIQAQVIIDGTSSNLSSSPSSRMKSRNKELKREEDLFYQRQLANKINQGLLSSSSSSADAVDLSLSKRNDNYSFSKPATNYNLQDYMSQTLGNNNDNNNNDDKNENVTIKIDGKRITASKFNITNILNDIAEIPLWVPSSLLPYVIIAQDELDVNDLKKIKSNVLSDSQFTVSSWDSCRFAGIYRGQFMEKNRASFVNLLSGIKNNQVPVSSVSTTSKDAIKKNNKVINENDVEEGLSSFVYNDVQGRMFQEGLSDKIQLFLMEDPEWRPGQDNRQLEPQPVIIAVSSIVVPDQGDNRGKAATLLSGLSIISTLFTTFAYAVSTYALNPNFFNGVVNESNLSSLVACIPVFLGVFALSAFHEVVHYVIAKNRGVKLGLPVPIPSFQIGTFGNITPLRSFPQSRSALFDIAISGPLLTALLSITMMISGILLTINTPTALITSLAVVPAAVVKMSFLVGSITSLLAPKVMMLPLSQPIPIHPLFLIGFAGLISSAVNMLPVGRLDGGRATKAVFGRRSSYLISLLTLTFMAISALTGFSTISIFWGLIITLFQRNADVPIQNELSEVNNARLGLYIFSMLLTLLTLAPFPGVNGAL